MSADPWRLPTDAAVRAMSRCFRLPMLEVTAPLGALDDPETLLERLFGRYLSGSEAPRDGRLAMGNGAAPSALGPKAKPAWTPTAAGDATRPSRTTARRDSPPDAVVSASPASDWLPGARRPDRTVAASADVVVAARMGDLLEESRSRSRDSSNKSSHQRPERANPAGSALRSDAVASRTMQADLAIAATAAPQLSTAGERPFDVPAAHLEPIRQQSGSGTPQPPVTRLGRGVVQLAAVLRADSIDVARDQPATAAASPSQAGQPTAPATSTPAELAENPQPQPQAQATAHTAGQPDQALVATVTEEVAGRLREELEWEFQRTYGLGG
jgi:hypothetical protein